MLDIATRLLQLAGQLRANRKAFSNSAIAKDAASARSDLLHGLERIGASATADRLARGRAWLGDDVFDAKSFEAEQRRKLGGMGLSGQQIQQMLKSYAAQREQAVGIAVEHARDVDTHAEALHALSQAARGSGAYWLLLRNYSLRRTVIPKADGHKGSGFSHTSGMVVRAVKSGDTQEVVADVLTPIAPVVAIADHLEIAHGGSQLLRLDLVDECWEDAARLMIGAAKGIVLIASEVTGPILFELQAILDAGRGQDAIVFVGDVADPVGDLISSVLGGSPNSTQKEQSLNSLMSRINRPNLFRRVVSVSDTETARALLKQWAAEIG